jgi:ketosteroid isomerase-like protein
MKNNVTGCLLGILLLAGVTVAHAQPTATEKAIADLENKWVQSQKANNPDLAAPMWADKFISIGADGKVSDRAQTLADAKATKYTSVDIKDLKITVFGDTAIANMVFDAKGTDEKGKPMNLHERWTDTWVKMPNGAWQCVASHGSTIKM